MTEREPIFSESNDFLSPDDPRLRKRSPEVPFEEILSPTTKETLDQMYGVARRVALEGLAAPQVGIEKRIILVDVAAGDSGHIGGLQAIINPEIVWSTATTVPHFEGCYSTPRELVGIVRRPILIRVLGYRPDQSHLDLTYHGPQARLIQHAVDHLDGLEFTDRIKDDADLHRVPLLEFESYCHGGRWRAWPYKFPRAEWERLRGSS